MRKKDSDPISVFQWIWQSYLKTALIPLVVVELVFVGIYFWANNWSRAETISYLQNSANVELDILAEKEAGIIDKQLADINHAANLYQLQTRLAFDQTPALSADDSGRLAYAENGAYYTTRDKTGGGAAVFYSGIVPIGAAERDKTARLLSLQDLMKNIIASHPLTASIYVNTRDSLNVIYPYFDVLSQYPEKMNIPEYNFYYEADLAHNPDKKVVWTDAYLDPAGHGWMASAIAPVYVGDTLEGVVGIDITVDTITDQILNWEFPWNGYGILVGKDGTILALPETGEEDWGLRELTEHHYDEAIKQDTFKPDDFNVYKRSEFSAIAEDMKNSTRGTATITLNNQPQLVSWNTVSETGWKLLVIVPESNIYAKTNAINRSLMQIGLTMIAGLVLFYSVFFYILFKRSYRMSQNISHPLHTINNILENIGKGDYYQDEPEMEVKEFQDTTRNLIAMGQKLGDANQELILTQTDLEESDQNLKALINAIDDIILQIDGNGRINKIWTKNDTEILPLSRGKEQTICAIMNPQDLPDCVEKISSVLKTGHPETVEYALDTHQGKRWFQARISAIDNNAQTLVVSARDITQRIAMEQSIKAAMEEAENANRAKSKFLSSMSHELRTPLNAILGFSQLLEMYPDEPLSPMQSEYVREIMRAGEHLLTLINEILDLARIESGRYTLLPEPVDLIELIDEITSLMQPLADQHEITMAFEPGELTNLITVTDRTRIKQILINLVSNAIKYNRDHGSVTVSLEKDDDHVRIHVYDTGYGIPADQLENIFSPFHRLPDSTRTIEGTGIGLTVVEQLSRLLNGHIHVESTPGKGSHFWLEVPVCENPESCFERE